MMEPVRLGLIGAGRWGQVYLHTMRSLGERCRLTHLGTRKPRNASLVPPGVRVEADWRRVVESDCDAVIIATPPATHAGIVEHCVDAGKPCLVEKPFCLDVPTAERLHERIERSGVPVLVDHTQLFNPAYQTLKRRLEQSREPIRVILAERLGTDHPPTDTPVVWEWGPHDVSLCLDLLEQLPHQVEALGGPPGPTGQPALVMLRLEFAGGCCAWIHTGWLAAQKRRTVSVVTDRRLYVCDDLAEEKLAVSSLDVDGRQPLPVGDERPLLKRQRPSAEVPVAGRPAMAAMLTYFLDGLAGGDRRYFGTSLALDIVRVLAACDAALKPEVSPSTP